MPATHSRTDTSVIQRLLDEPQRFEFFQAVRLVVQWLGEHGIPPDKALAEYLRFQNSLSLGFPASQIEALQAVAGRPLGDHPSMSRAMQEQQGLQVRITPTFMGFLGTHGALPPHFTERIIAWQSSEQDEAPRAFLDMLSNRMLALFYEAWRKHRVEQCIEQGADGFLPLLLALVGFQRGERLNNADGVCDEAIARFAGLLQQRPMSAIALGRVLSGYLGVPVRVQEAIGHWNPMAAHEQSALGMANATLGDDTMIGENAWRPDLRVRLSLGPLWIDEFDRFLPHAPGAMAIKKMLSLFGEQTLTYEVELVLRKSQAQPVRLAGGNAACSRLGLDSFLLTGPATVDRRDMRYDIRPMEALPPIGKGKRVKT
ncbi:type VI secretion system baseplate subunit TssG [Massilia horti]|uniref:Type VI secretion system baseplate subunit TssG n=1 Tax=Massilia horti TaxID=2562153 RepID=A0A4Y9SYW4_9BURK|nr:type VI secretion system baseplate subunit TssG [Massilia horti]TFW31646.1 type VI secretion system baseplate subunit TssG [Massilia horti]